MVLAARGTRKLDGEGEEPIADEAEKKALRGQARRVWLKTVALTAIGTALVYALPF